MAIAFDSISNVTPATTDPLSWTHTTAGGTIKGVLVFIIENNTTTSTVVGATYGGVTMSHVTSSPLNKGTGESNSISCFFLGSGITSGNQTVSVDMSNTSYTRIGVSIALTSGGGNTAVQDTTTITNDSLLDPTGTLSLGGKTCFCAQGWHSGLATVGNVAPWTGWNSRYEFDFGQQVGGVYTYDTIGSADVTNMGFDSSAADDVNVLGVAVYEITSGGGLFMAGSYYKA